MTDLERAMSDDTTAPASRAGGGLGDGAGPDELSTIVTTLGGHGRIAEIDVRIAEIEAEREALVVERREVLDGIEALNERYTKEDLVAIIMRQHREIEELRRAGAAPAAPAAPSASAEAPARTVPAVAQVPVPVRRYDTRKIYVTGYDAGFGDSDKGLPADVGKRRGYAKDGYLQGHADREAGHSNRGQELAVPYALEVAKHLAERTERERGRPGEGSASEGEDGEGGEAGEGEGGAHVLADAHAGGEGEGDGEHLDRRNPFEAPAEAEVDAALADDGGRESFV